ncbi:MAG: NAD-dependent epimerase/dehydratase family protein [Spirochaetales bacterium]|nr:MAG: NAD-dependent epimerase/dehydratase family protein [Spirochaetales bacterium]
MNPSGRRILVTGASGFLGRHFCRDLLERGYRVRAVHRRADPPAELLTLADEGLELVRLDLHAPGASTVACEGIDMVLHAAALAYDWGPFDAFRKANVDLTASLLEAAERAGCADFIFMSSAAVHGFGPHEDTTEDGPFHELRYPYPITKLMAENLVRSRNRPGFRTVAVRPCNVYGPDDETSTYEMYRAILGGSFGYIGNGSSYTCPIYVDDLCEGVARVLACDGLGGEAIILTDGMKVSWKAYTEAMFAALRSRKRPLAVPVPLAFAAAGAMSLGARVLRSAKAPPLTRYRVEQVASHYHFSNEKARRVLGFEPRIFFLEGLRLTAEAYLRSRGAG